MKNKIYIGTVGYPVKKQRILAEVDTVELTECKQLPPSGQKARQWRASAPGHVLFTAQVSRHFVDPLEAGTLLPGNRAAYGNFQVTEENLGLWQKQIKFAKGVEAQALVLITPPRITPSMANCDQMTAFLSKIDREDFNIVWEPHGPWSIEVASEFAAQNNLILAVDPLRDTPPAGSIGYFRFGPFAALGSRISVYELETIAEMTQLFETVFCLFDTQRAFDDARNLKKIIGGEQFDDDF